MYRLTNYFFGLLLIYLFILEGNMGEHVRILAALALAITIAYFAFFVNWVSLDATKAVILVGVIVLGFGGWILAATIVFFFVSSSILTRYNSETNNSSGRNPAVAKNKRRDGYQVWANGFWVAVFCTLWFIFGTESTLIAAFAAIATATADTWATELGTLKPGKTRLITTFELVEPGTEGGVSFKGTIAAILGTLLISLFVFLSDTVEPVRFFIVIIASGIAGCILDSIIGAVFFKKQMDIPPPVDFSSSFNSFTNSFINWTATGFSGILAFLIVQLFLT